MGLQLDLLGGAEAPAVRRAGELLLLPVESIDESPEQPRLEFDPETLQELAQTIAERGVRQPISVRPHPTDAERWILNFGARRLRASRLAGKTEIPAYVDDTVDTYDQVIENEQREGLKPLELALFIQRRLDTGESRAEIARRLGKDRSYVTRACALIGAPDWLMALYRAGRCTGTLELYELSRLYRDHPEDVERWAGALSYIGRADVERLKAMHAASLVEPAGERPDQRVAPCNSHELQTNIEAQALAGVAPFNTSGELERPGGGEAVAPNSVAPCNTNPERESQTARESAAEVAQGPAACLPDSVRPTDVPHGSHGAEPLSAAGAPRATARPALTASDPVGSSSGLEEAKRQALSALSMLRQAMATMQTTPRGGAEALQDLRAQLLELATG